LCDPNLWAAAAGPDNALAAADLESQAQRALVEAMEEAVHSGAEPGLKTVLASLEDDDLKGLAVTLAATVDQVTDRNAKRLGEHSQACFRPVVLERPRPPPATPRSDVSDRLAAVRARHAAHGGDRRILGKSQ